MGRCCLHLLQCCVDDDPGNSGGFRHVPSDRCMFSSRHVINELECTIYLIYISSQGHTGVTARP